ncbi:hypothetical protein DFH08DRAFT_384262 [Mycena albidolilacea]|uniref:Secreted protein n=1 Tax=Mycena albidolilacea TaxID=1033008 RepID=A0AAD6ZGT3_9AGAR|nr:hypothetical protein DFH08DRAFT_384262 [Mycena albidolilacea]
MPNVRCPTTSLCCLAIILLDLHAQSFWCICAVTARPPCCAIFCLLYLELKRCFRFSHVRSAPSNNKSITLTD